MRCRYIKLITANGPAAINELLVKDTKGRVIEPANASDYPELFDEAALYPGYGSFLSGTVFDESVFARTAYEYLHGLVSFEDTHPPLGKVLISWGIACFGPNPFGYRVPGVVAGALLLAVIWVFASRLMKDSRIAVAVTALFALDFLHFTESRLGQTDSFLVLFTTSMYYFMYRYGEENEKGKRGWRFLLQMVWILRRRWACPYLARGIDPEIPAGGDRVERSVEGLWDKRGIFYYCPSSHLSFIVYPLCARGSGHGILGEGCQKSGKYAAISFWCGRGSRAGFQVV
jgi:hypothetical protein